MPEPSLPEESIFAHALDMASAAERAAFLGGDAVGLPPQPLILLTCYAPDCPTGEGQERARPVRLRLPQPRLPRLRPEGAG